MFAKMPLRDRLFCFADFVGITLLALLFLLPLPIWFPSICLTTLFAAVLNLFLPLKTSAYSGKANSNKSTPTRFAARVRYLRKRATADFAITCAIALIARQRCRPIPL